MLLVLEAVADDRRDLVVQGREAELEAAGRGAGGWRNEGGHQQVQERGEARGPIGGAQRRHFDGALAAVGRIHAANDARPGHGPTRGIDAVGGARRAIWDARTPPVGAACCVPTRPVLGDG